jgi:hypothetical protein
MARFSPALEQIAQNWPKDSLRPAIQFSNVLAYLSSSNSLAPTTVAAARALVENRVKNQVRFFQSEICSDHHFTDCCCSLL